MWFSSHLELASILLFVLCAAGATRQWLNRRGLEGNEVFHIAGLYDSLRERWLLPEVDNWNYRPIAYRLFLALLTFVPINLLGWSETFFRTFPILAALLITSPLCWLLAGDNRHRHVWLVQMAVLWVFLFSTHQANHFCAESVAAIISAACLVATPRLASRGWVRQAGFLASLLSVLILLKGVTALLAFPVLVRAAFSWGLRATLRATGAALLGTVVVLLSFFSQELALLAEIGVYHRHPWRFVWPQHTLFDNLSNILLLLIGGLTLHELGRRSYGAGPRIFLQNALIVLSVIIACATLYVSAGIDFSYHLAPLFVFAAVGACSALSQARTLPPLLPLAGCAILALSTLLSPSSQRYLGRETIDGLTEADEVLYLTYGSAYARYGYPFACGQHSAHRLQRPTKRDLRQSIYVRRQTAAYLDCILHFSGAAVVWNPRWVPLDHYPEVRKMLKSRFKKTRLLGERLELWRRKRSGTASRDVGPHPRPPATPH